MEDMSDSTLRGYAYLHCRTEVGAFHKKHVARLLRMAGDIEDAERVENGREWYHLGPSTIDPILAKIDAREKSN